MSGFYVRYAGARIEKKMETRRLIIEPMTTEETEKNIPAGKSIPAGMLSFRVLKPHFISLN